MSRNVLDLLGYAGRKGARRLRIEVHVVLTAQNAPALEAMYDAFVKEMGADGLHVNLYGALRDPDANRDLGLSIPAYLEAICRALVQRFRGRRLRDF